MRYPAAIPALAFLAGTAVGWRLPASPVPAWMLLGVCTLAWGGSLTTICFRAWRGFVVVSTAGFVLVGLLLGAHAGTVAEYSTLRQWFDDRQDDAQPLGVVTIQGRLLRDAMPTDYGAQLIVDAEQVEHAGHQIPVSGGLRVGVGGSFVADHRHQWVAGRRVRMPVSLRRAPRHLNPGVHDQERRLMWRGIALLGSVKSALLVDVTRIGSTREETAAAARSAVRRIVRDAVGSHSRRSAGIVTAILIGDRAGLDSDTQRRLQEGGTFHVIAISGGNIAILTGVLLLVLRVVGVSPRAAAATAIVCLLGYWQVVGFEASVSRATFAASLFLAARVVDHRTSALNTLALSAIGLVAVDPLTLGDPGFLLTYGATLGILVGVPRVLPAVQTRCESLGPLGTRVLVPLAGLFVATVCAELVLLPVAAFVFSRVTAAGLVLNFVAVPLMTVTQIAGMAVLGAAMISTPLAAACGYVAHLATVGITASAHLVDVVPQLAQRVPPPGPVTTCAYYAGWMLVLLPGRRRRMTSAGGLSLAAGAATAIVLGPIRVTSGPTECPRPTPELRVLFLDVDQADATLVQFPTGQTMLVDAAGSARGTSVVGERVVAPALWRAGVRRVDYLVLTHGDPDHVGGAGAVMDDFDPREVWVGVPVPRSERLQEIKAIALERGTAWRRLQTGDIVRVGDVEIIVRHPPAPDWERQRVRNDDSVVLEIRHGDVTFVLPGDIGKEVEAILGRQVIPAVEMVLKVPHHGSRTSSTTAFIEALAPTLAIVSAGRHNPFGHPDESVLRRYEAAGTRVLQTGKVGAVSVCSDGHRIRVETEASG